jgi:nitrogen regulatory protein P-II 1
MESALNALDRFGIVGITVAEVRGYDKRYAITQSYRGVGFAPPLLPKVKLEIVVEDHLTDAVVDVLIAAARTGIPGDGKIFLLPVSDAVRVRTGENGKIAVA